MKFRRLLFVPVLATGVFFILWACGADSLQAPAVQRAPASSQCSSISDLMPVFLNATRSGKTAGLQYVVQTYLTSTAPDQHIPALNAIFGATLRSVSKFAAQPAEAGAPPGERCAVQEPPLAEAHPLCETRRALKHLVHNGAGVQAMELADPLMSAVINYVVGREPSSSVPHYNEIGPVLSGMCEQSATCNMKDTLELLSGMLAFAQTPEGQAGLDRLETLVNHPDLQLYLTDDGNDYGGEKGFVALARLLMQTVEGMDDPSDLNALPTAAFPAAIRPLLETGIGDLKLMLSSTRSPNILRPLQKVSHCVGLKDPQLNLVRMIYRLSIEAPIPEFGLHNMVHILAELRRSDSRGSLMWIGAKFIQTLKDDDQAADAAAYACRTLFSTQMEPGKLKSNAEMALPVVADLFRDRVLNEAVCAADTLLYGCAGGTQPACNASPVP
jgi:hypothetical protein